MKILVIHTFYKSSGGEDIVVLQEIELMKKNGHEVQLLSFNNSSLVLIKLLLMPFNLFSYFQTKRAIKSFNPDVIHIHNLHFGASPSVIYAARSLRIPMVLTLHNYRLLCPSGSLFFNGKLFLHSLKDGFPWAAVKNGVYRNSRILTFWMACSTYLHRKLNTLEKVDKFIVLGMHSFSLFSKSHLRNLSDKILIKPNFSEQVQFESSDDSQYFIYIGRLAPEKGIDTLIRAFQGQPFHLKIIGNGELKQKVLNACEQNTNIEYLGQQTHAHAQTFLQNAQALIFPSEWFETFGMVLSESFSKAVPVIASSLGNIKDIVENGYNGLTFEPGNYLDLRAKVYQFSAFSPQEKMLYKKSAVEAYQKKYTPTANYRNLNSIYKTLINKHSYPPSPFSEL